MACLPNSTWHMQMLVSNQGSHLPHHKMHVWFGLSIRITMKQNTKNGYWSHHQNSAFPVHCQFMVNKGDKKIINIPLNNIIFTTILYFIYRLEITPFYNPFCICWLWCTAHQMGFIHNILETHIIEHNVKIHLSAPWRHIGEVDV